jgi:hypothetical protein
VATAKELAEQHRERAEELLARAEKQILPWGFNATAATAHATLALYYLTVVTEGESASQ